MEVQYALPETEEIERSPSFTLGTALMWLGHDCRGRCPATVTDCRANVWFMHLPEQTIAAWNKTLVEVDFGNDWSPGDEHRELLSQVNFCVWSDHMRVRHRTAIERATFFAALASRRGLRHANQLPLSAAGGISRAATDPRAVPAVG